MNLVSFIHPARTFLPCSGVGRHMIGVLRELAREPEVELSLLYSKQWLVDGRLPPECPLRDLPGRGFAARENLQERFWKLFGGPALDPALTQGADWIYSPMETRLPVRNAPVAFTLHDVQPFETDLPWADAKAQRRNRRMWGMWVPKAIREARLVFTVSEFSKRRMIDLLGVPEGKIVVSGNGVDEGYFREPEGVRTGSFMNHRPYVLLVGGLRREKGGVESLAVARILRKTCPDLEFRVAGLPNDPNLVAIAEGLGNFHFAGKVDDAMLSGLYREARCLLFLSLYEGFGMPPLEAMACRTPVICANRASLPEVVGEAARLVEPESADEIADWIAEIVRHPRAAGGLIAKGREQAAALTWQRVASRVKEALAQHQWPTPPMGKRCP